MNKKDYQDFEIKLNMKTIMLFEEMADKSFYSIDNDDFVLLIYCSLVINNNQKIPLQRFITIFQNEKIAKTLMRKCQEELDFMTNLTKINKVEDKNNESKEVPDKLTNVINMLVLQYGLDINYVMNDMRMWELPALIKAMEEKTKVDLVQERFWTYLQICPHIDNKKVKSPEDLIPFPWEKDERKQRNLKELENNRFAIKNMIGKNIFGEPLKKEENNE